MTPFVRSTPSRRCTTTHYRFLIPLSRCGKNGYPTSPASSSSSPATDGQVAGHLCIAVAQRPRRSHVADFGICVGAQWQNRGVASALMRTMIDMCDNWLRVDRIELTVFVDNEPAIAVYKKHGFEIEGTGKRYALRNGEYVDAYYMARMK